MFSIFKLILHYHDWNIPDPQDVDYSYNWDNWNTAFWFLVIFCIVIFNWGKWGKK